MARWLPVAMMLGLTLWLNWYFIRAVSEHGTLLLETGEFNYDRLINMGFAKAAQEWGINFFEPFNRIEPIFYQFSGWWGLGFAARLTGLQPWAVANLIHLLYVPLFFLLAWRLFSFVVRSRDAAFAGIGILFLFSNLEWFLNHAFMKRYGTHAVLFPFLQQSFGFYMDSYSVLFGYGALFAWLKYLQTETPDWKQILPFLLPAIVALNLHFLPAIFFMLLFMMLLFAVTYSELDSVCRRRIGCILAGMALVYLGALAYWSSRPPMGFICVLAGSVWALFYLHERKRSRYLLALAPILPVVLLAGSNLLALQSYYGSLANDYNEAVRHKQLGIPVRDLLICYFPVVVLAVVSLYRETDSRWRMVKGTILLAAAAVIFNDKLGYNNHPYRFIPYTYPVWAMLAGDGLARLLRSWRQPAAIIVLCLTLPTLGMGVWANIRHHRLYAIAANCTPVEPLVIDIVAAIEAERRTFPQAVFYVAPSILTADRLAPYTGAKFFFSAEINYRSSYRFYWRHDEMLRAARANGLPVNFVILPIRIDGKSPLRVIESGQQRYMMYRVVNYELDV